MTKPKEIPEIIGTQGWEQFLATKQEMLYQYDLAKIYAESHIVKVTHGNVAEATFRKWLGNFLPKKYGVTSGYIVSQNPDFIGLKLPHYDVIIYDQLNSPVLWVEENSDHSEGGKTRAIPAEYVHSVVEVKANLTVQSSAGALKKILELKPLLQTSSKVDPYSGKLPLNFFSAIVFFELLKQNEFKKQILNNVICELEIPYYGGIILKGEGREINDTGLFRTLIGEDSFVSTVGSGKESLITGSPLSDTKKIDDNQFVGTMLTWAAANFSFFAFDIIALLEGKYKSGFISSSYGMTWLNPERHEK